MIPELNLFMICSDLNEQALSNIPKSEYVIWKELHIDNKAEYEEF